MIDDIPPETLDAAGITPPVARAIFAVLARETGHDHFAAIREVVTAHRRYFPDTAPDHEMTAAHALEISRTYDKGWLHELTLKMESAVLAVLPPGTSMESLERIGLILHADQAVFGAPSFDHSPCLSMWPLYLQACRVPDASLTIQDARPSSGAEPPQRKPGI